MFKSPEAIRLANGVMMPRIGYGLFRVSPGASTREAVERALAVGYRLFDTAAVYRNESDLGAAISAAELPRDQVFVTSKVWNDDQGYDATRTAFRRAQRALGAIDLYLLHWPVPRHRLASWRALEDLYLEGEVRAIGVSNFMVHHLDELRATARIVPMVNQIELSLFLPQRELASYCAEAGIAITAYSPLTKGVRLDHPVLRAEAARRGVTSAQLLLAWVLAQGHALVVKSSDPARMRENLQAGHIALDAAALALLAELDEGLVTGWDPRNQA